MADLQAILNKKVAGIPVLAIGVVGVGILAFVAYKMDGKVISDDAETEPLDESDDISAAIGADYSALETNGTVTVTGQDGTSVSTEVTVMTNERWLSQGVNYLVSSQLATGGNAQGALQKYLDGEQLTFDEGTLRDYVIAKYGIPPDAPVVGGTGAKPAQKQGNPPLSHTVKTTGSDDTYPRLAQLYYGRSDNAAVTLIIGANRNIPLGGSLAVGTQVNVPKFTSPGYYITKSGYTTATAIAKKNGISTPALTHLNPSMSFPVKVGTKVRVK